MRTSFTILTILIFISCSSTKNLTTDHIIGKYQWNGIYGIGSTIELKADQTFEYNWQTGLIRGTTFGTWEKDGTQITLNSNLQPPENGIENFEIIETEKNKSDSLLIKVIGSDNESVPFAACVLKQNTTTLTGASTDFQGETKLPKLEADSLIISFIGYKTIRHRLDSSVSTYVFKMEEENEYYEYFTNEKWTYKNERLYDPSIKKDKYVEKDYYEKIK
ncbi:carboxypeptidase-like regulatory domain-containing protein [Psychroflexus sp. YR1-1]|uniref:Carboxypeptidase-like regulatory domain-containing protein n=1 Tax=Psychroflexus aurantiacus TaxID=2709310 RepID=A0A6B3R777_9FLAO|nr:carboxypeptidase-like regulatory domain-containing protein [Psychroflexus aurantiacus]NEV95065.1 carboxypeptidase-like regulatory domain-containing protein [Psychroflexus aurantiacus]